MLKNAIRHILCEGKCLADEPGGLSGANDL